MSQFSYVCEKTDKPIYPGDEVRLYHLDDGNVVEEMRGFYNGLGSVDLETKTFHQARGEHGDMVDVDMGVDEVTCESDMWAHTEFKDMLEAHFDKDDSRSGVSCVLECDVPLKYIPKRISMDTLMEAMVS